MNKLLFFISTIFLLVSCSKDNNVLNPTDPSDTKYKVILNVDVPKVSIETSPLKVAVADGDPIFYNLVIYKNSGEIYYDWYYDVVNNSSSTKPANVNNENVNIFTNTENKISTPLLLPPGDYHIAMMIYRKDVKHPNTSLSPIYTENYNTDNFGSYLVKAKNNKIDNGGIYFNTTDLTVIASAKDQSLSMELKPMWSYIDVNIENAQTFEVPEGTNALQFVINPLYYGFNVKTKLAPFIDDRPIVISLDSIRAASTFNLRNTVSKSILESNKISTTIKYLKIGTDTIVLQTKELPISNLLENGYYYNIHGKLGNSNTNSSQTMNISLGSFAKDDVNINF